VQDEGRIFKNTAVLMLGQGVGDLCLFLFLIFFARAYGPNMLGEYSLSMAIGSVLGMFVSFGLNAPLRRDVSRQPELGPVYVGSALHAQLLFAVGAALLLVGVATLMNLDARAHAILLLIGGYHIVHRLSMVSHALFSAHERMHYSAMLEAGHRMIILLLGSAAIYLGGSPSSALAAYPLGAGLMLFAGWMLSVRSFGWPVLKPDPRLISHRLQIALPFFGIIILAELYARLGIMILGALHGEEAVGTYTAAERLTLIIGIGHIMLSAAVVPVMSRLAGGAEARLRELYIRCQRVLIVTTLPAATVLFLLRDPVIVLVFGEAYKSASPVLGVLTLGVLVTGLNQLQLSLLVACNCQQSLFLNQLLALALFLAAAYLVVPRWGIVGLAGCMVGCNTCFFAMNYALAERTIVRTPLAKLIGGPVAACLGASIVFYLLDDSPLGIQLAFTLLIGAVCMGLFKAVALHDFIYLGKLMRGTRSSSAFARPHVSQ
jgi:O-antigen/teichoic acid export membrane protein